MTSSSDASDSERAAAVTRLVGDLERRFKEAVQRSLRFDLDGSVTSLAVVDHYLAQAREETRAPILSLLAAGAGAYFGELVRRHIGGLWLGDGKDPRHLRLLLTPAFVYFSPADLALTAILGEEPDPDDPRAPDGVPLDPGFHLDAGARLPHRKRPPEPEPEPADAEADPDDPPEEPPDPTRLPHDDGSDDATWIAARLAELAPVPEDQFYSLTARYETLELILEMLAARREAGGYEPYTYTVQDYLQAFS
jgi:hypothetical protein